MTIIYRPAPIKTEEQAEALPVGTLARDPSPSPEDVGEWDVAQFAGNGLWLSGGTAWTHGYVIGWTALVPTEAEEETARDISPEVGEYGPDDEIPEHYLGPPRTRYTTPWEEA